ncbi:GNAT family N-acetyltransferase [Reichenbachiella versicolor]|uniref:GNAT family N-acetyltransferase n=1 Tax=Reichenbachiella versicolor TaxID=1821036 RepID=UPI0016285FB2|nr:GNAT family N-acetyltransferase [Reichenbachiella versicolor]
MAITVRNGLKTDLPKVFELIKELAEFEKAPNEVDNTIEMMEEDGFGDNPVFGFLIAEEEGNTVGMSLYYYRYSTWKGRRLYLEDLIVTESYRGKGVGSALMDATINYAKEVGCTGMMWQALDWNTPALDFYKKYGATFDNEWVNCSLQF